MQLACWYMCGGTDSLAASGNSLVILFGKPQVPGNALLLPGKHNFLLIPLIRAELAEFLQ